MHNIHYLEVEEKADRNKILAHIEYHASHDGDGYCGKVKWHDNISPCKNREEAEKLISKLDNGWYDDHAVRYYDYSSAVTTKKIEELKAKRMEVIDKKNAYMHEHSFSNFKAEYIGCSNCGSKLSKKYLRGYYCPVCRGDMRSETIKKKLADFDQKNEHILEQIEIEKQKQKKAQKVMWLVKYEYHS